MEIAAAVHVHICSKLLHKALNADSLLLPTTAGRDSFHPSVAVGSGFETAHPAQFVCASGMGPTPPPSDCCLAWGS